MKEENKNPHLSHDEGSKERANPLKKETQKTNSGRRLQIQNASLGLVTKLLPLSSSSPSFFFPSFLLHLHPPTKPFPCREPARGGIDKFKTSLMLPLEWYPDLPTSVTSVFIAL
jgi:hypothetical protein